MRLYHITALSNFMRGYDRYRREYDKSGIPESRFPDRFFLLSRDELGPGFQKAQNLVQRLGLPGDRPLLMATDVDPSALRQDHDSGVGQYVQRDHISVSDLAWIEADAEDWRLTPVRVEEAAAASFAIRRPILPSWNTLRPRSISILPIGLACQASCKFCFSKASVSSDFRGRIRDWDSIDRSLAAALTAGAERAVITGGGEPTLLKEEDLTQLIRKTSQLFRRTVLISNGATLLKGDDRCVEARLANLGNAGLSVLAISRHHHSPAKATRILGLDVDLARLARLLRKSQDGATSPKAANTTLRLVCVLQKGGVETTKDIQAYLEAAAALGITEVNFKELYVSTGIESSYADRAANDYSAAHQVPLRIVQDFTHANGWNLCGRLPWGAPIFSGSIKGRPMRIAAYTEPSTQWELSNGIARSWNHMSDGRVLASLEDMQSDVDINEFL